MSFGTLPLSLWLLWILRNFAATESLGWESKLSTSHCLWVPENSVMAVQMPEFCDIWDQCLGLDDSSLVGSHSPCTKPIFHTQTCKTKETKTLIPYMKFPYMHLVTHRFITQCTHFWFYLILCMGVLSEYMSVYDMVLIRSEDKEESPGTGMSCRVGTRSQTQILWKNSKCSPSVFISERKQYSKRGPLTRRLYISHQSATRCIYNLRQVT